MKGVLLMPIDAQRPACLNKLDLPFSERLVNEIGAALESARADSLLHLASYLPGLCTNLEPELEALQVVISGETIKVLAGSCEGLSVGCSVLDGNVPGTRVATPN
jgi:hypothetical protein